MRAHGVWFAALVLTLAAAAGFALRMTPFRLAPDTPAGGDRAYHLRMVEAASGAGIAPLDSLSSPPAGRATAGLLPIGMYLAAGALHRALGGAPEHLARDAAWFTALAGALIVWPVWLLARAVGLSQAAALLAALLAAVMPAHVHRTYSGWLRYDGPGTLLAVFHLALLARALAAASARARRALAAAAGVTMIAALAVWRVVIVFPLLEAVLAALVFAARGGRREDREAFTIALVAVWAGTFVVPYLAAQGAGLAPWWLAAMFAALAVWLPAAPQPGAGDGAQRGARSPAASPRPAWFAPGWARRGATAAAAAGAGWLLGGFARPVAAASDYAPVAGLIAGRVRLWLTPDATLDPLVALLLGVEELQPVSPAGLAGSAYLSWLAPLLLASGVWFAWRTFRSRGAVRAGPMLFAVLCVALVAGTMLWARTKVLLAPLAAVAIAALLDAARGTPGAPAKRRAKGRAPAARARLLRPVVALAIVAAAAGAAWTSWRIVTSRTSSIDSGLAAAYGFLRESAEPGTVLLGPWGNGYELETHTGHPAVMDGLLESRENQRRIVAFAAAAMARRADSLAAFCDRYDARYLLVPPSTQLYGIALLARVPFVRKLIPGIPLTPDEADRTLIRMMVFGREEPGFRKVFEQGAYRVYRRDRAAPVAP